MPKTRSGFASKKQRGWMWVHMPATARKWAHEARLRRQRASAAKRRRKKK